MSDTAKQVRFGFLQSVVADARSPIMTLGAGAASRSLDQTAFDAGLAVEADHSHPTAQPDETARNTSVQPLLPSKVSVPSNPDISSHGPLDSNETDTQTPPTVTSAGATIDQSIDIDIDATNSSNPPEPDHPTAGLKTGEDSTKDVNPPAGQPLNPVEIISRNPEHPGSGKVAEPHHPSERKPAISHKAYGAEFSSLPDDAGLVEGAIDVVRATDEGNSKPAYDHSGRQAPKLSGVLTTSSGRRGNTIENRSGETTTVAETPSPKPAAANTSSSVRSQSIPGASTAVGERATEKQRSGGVHIGQVDITIISNTPKSEPRRVPERKSAVSSATRIESRHYLRRF